jgi:DNA modification methylase
VTPYLSDPDVTLHCGDALEVLRTLSDRSVHMCATSPPFYGLRDYGVEGQIGLEEGPDEWVARLVEVFREVKRVLRDDGMLWVEIGDSYASNGPGGMEGSTLTKGGKQHRSNRDVPKLRGGCKPKDLLGQPWLLAFALRADGWYLRSEIIWARPNCMPESVTDRPTKSHSTIFLLAKKPRYYFDAEAIREPYSPASIERSKYVTQDIRSGSVDREDGLVKSTKGVTRPALGLNPGGANARTVWWQATEPTPFAHFATFPQKLVSRMILAGTSERGVCPECGAPWVRETVSEPEKPNAKRQRNVGGRTDGFTYPAEPGGLGLTRVTTLGWRPSCPCFGDGLDGTHVVGPPPIPATVLDPFSGSGTTGLVARKLGRHAVLIELSEPYCSLAADRLAQQVLEPSA